MLRILFSRILSSQFSLGGAVLCSLATTAPVFSEVTEESIVQERHTTATSSYDLLLSGDEAYDNGDYSQAVADFRVGFEQLKVGQSTQLLKTELADRLATAATQEAKRLTKIGKLNEAKALIESVLAKGVAPDHQGAHRQLNRLNDPITTNPALTSEHVTNVDDVRRLLYTAEGAFNLGQYDESAKLYNEILAVDPYNKAARKGLEKISAYKSDYARTSYDHARAKLFSEVDKAWETPVPVSSAEFGTALQYETSGSNETGASYLISKMNAIIIPSIDFEDVDLLEAVDFLRIRTKELDDTTLDPAAKGVQFVVKATGSTPAEQKRFSLRLNNVSVRHALDTIAAMSGVKMLVDDFAVILTKYDGENSALVTRSYNVAPDFLTNSAQSSSSTEDDPFSSDSSEDGELFGKKVTAKEMLTNFGITFPEGSSATYIPATSSLVVKNTEDQLDHISQIINSFSAKQPLMVQLEVKLISVQQDNTKELGTDWTVQGTILDAIDDGFAIAGGSLGNGDSIPDLDGRPITAGNRSGNGVFTPNSIDDAISRELASSGSSVSSTDPFVRAANPDDPDAGLLSSIFTEGTPGSTGNTNPSPGIFSVSAALDQSTVQAMVRGLDQKKSTDFLVNPTVVTKSGNVASLQLGREFIYATEYEPPEISEGSANTTDVDDNLEPDSGPLETWRITWDPNPLRIESIQVNGTSYSNFASSVTPSHPTAFESVLLGMDLEIEPTISEDGKTIDLSIRKTYREFDGYINYGTPINVVTTTVEYSDEYIANTPSLRDPLPPGSDFWAERGIDTFPPGVPALEGATIVNQTFKEATPNAILMPVFSTINTDTSVTIYDGATLVLGSMLQSQQRPFEDKTPFLGSLPLIGNLFQSSGSQKINKQVLVTISAKVIDPTGRQLNPAF